MPIRKKVKKRTAKKSICKSPKRKCLKKKAKKQVSKKLAGYAGTKGKYALAFTKGKGKPEIASKTYKTKPALMKAAKLAAKKYGVDKRYIK